MRGRGLGTKLEQAVCQGLQLRMRSLYTRVPFRTSCRGVEVGIAFSERVMADMTLFVGQSELRA